MHDAGFDVRCASIDEDDRSTFDELVKAASSYIEREACDRPCLLVGESFGGALATVVAQQASNVVEGVVLVNPATCYAESALASKAPPILELPAWAYYVGLASLLPLFVDRHGVRALFDIVTNKRLPCVIETPRQEAYMGRVALSLPERIARMPRGTLVWRLREWLDVGAKVDVGALKQPTLVVFGDEDNTLPSEREAARVVALLTKARAVRVPGADAATLGVASTCEPRSRRSERSGGFFPGGCSPEDAPTRRKTARRRRCDGAYPRTHAPVAVFDWRAEETRASAWVTVCIPELGRRRARPRHAGAGRARTQARAQFPWNATVGAVLDPARAPPRRPARGAPAPGAARRRVRDGRLTPCEAARFRRP